MSQYSLREVRERIMSEHVAAENRQDVAGTIATFHSARYEVFPFGSTADGAAAVGELLGGIFQAFPDFHVETKRTYHSDDALIMELEMSGTHKGPLGELPPSGRKMRVPLVAICVFEADRLICEKIYYDMATLMRQLAES